MMAPCPVCLDHFGERNLVEFDSPEAGWPTHCSKEHYEQDDQHHLYAPRLREANEDEHDLRSGRLLAEFQNLPGE
jgi:splicing suppressor protein 51